MHILFLPSETAFALNLKTETKESIIDDIKVIYTYPAINSWAVYERFENSSKNKSIYCDDCEC